MSTHQADGVSFRSVLPEDIDWKPFAAFPPSARLAVVVGDPTGPGGTPHFRWARSGEYVTQISAMGPLGMEYVEPSDDPRRD